MSRLGSPKDGLVTGQIVEDDRDMAVPTGGGDLIHEIGDFDPSAPLVMPVDDLAGRDIAHSSLVNMPGLASTMVLMQR
jgi:hypothetical protein